MRHTKKNLFRAIGAFSLRAVRKRFFCFRVVLCVAFMVCSVHKGHTQGDVDPVEFIVRGKQYESLKGYKHDQLREALIRILASKNLLEFTEDELYQIIKETRQRQKNGEIPDKSLDLFDKELNDLFQQLNHEKKVVESEDYSSEQMQEMLDGYLRGHENIDEILIDPKKMKSIMIDPQQ